MSYQWLLICTAATVHAVAGYVSECLDTGYWIRNKYDTAEHVGQVMVHAEDACPWYDFAMRGYCIVHVTGTCT